MTKLTNHVQRARLITPSTDKHYSLDSEDYFRSGCRNVSHQQQFFSQQLSPGPSHNLNRVVYTNKLLYKMKLSDTSLCTFCGEYEESLEHLFLRCQFSKNFWMQIVSWLNEFNVTIIELKDNEIMFGYTNESPHWTFLNNILIIGKQVIYSNRLGKSKPLFSQFIVKRKYIERIEHYIAKSRITFMKRNGKSYENEFLLIYNAVAILYKHCSAIRR